MHRLLFVLGLLIAIPIAGPAAANDLSICGNFSTPPDVGIDACGRLISSGKLKGADLAATFTRRGTFRRLKGDKERTTADFERAIADFNEAIRLNPKDKMAYNQRGIAHQATGNLDAAIRDYDTAIRLDPKYALAYGQRAVAYRLKGDFDRAIADAGTGIGLAPNQEVYRRERAAAYEGKRQLELALVDFRAALALDRNSKVAAEGVRRIEQALAAVKAAAAPAPASAPAVAVERPPAPDAVAPSAGGRVALVIGNGNYQHATRLPNPSNDATDVAQALRKLGFEVVEGRDLDKRGMEEKVREFGRKLDNADLALFFYAGHGMQVGGRNYLLPVDSKLERPGDLNFETIDVSFILGQMEADQRVNLVFLDACRDNPLARSFARSLGTRSASVGQGLASIQSAVGTMIAYATQPEAVALDGDGRNSPFTTALLKHIGTPGLEIGALMRRVRSDVIAATRQKQVPWDHSSLTGDVILAR